MSMVELLEIREVNKLKNYLSSSLNNVLFAIYQNDDNNECIEFKKTFLSKIYKSNVGILRELLNTLHKSILIIFA